MYKKCGAVGAIYFIYLSISILYLSSISFLFSFYKSLSFFLSGLPFFLALERFAKEWESNPKN
jgi:hypothetical protein